MLLRPWRREPEQSYAGVGGAWCYVSLVDQHPERRGRIRWGWRVSLPTGGALHGQHDERRRAEAAAFALAWAAVRMGVRR